MNFISCEFHYKREQYNYTFLISLFDSHVAYKIFAAESSLVGDFIVENIRALATGRWSVPSLGRPAPDLSRAGPTEEAAMGSG